MSVMKESGRMVVYVGTFIIVMVGYIVTLLVADFLIDVVSGIVIYPKDWGFGVFAVIDYLTPSRLTWLVYALGWFLVCILVHYGSTRWLEEGKIDVLAAIAYSDERNKQFDFNSETVVMNWGQVYVPEISEIKSFVDLNGKKMAVLKGDIYYHFFIHLYFFLNN